MTHRIAIESLLDTPETKVAARLLSERHSCRGFRSEQVPHEVIERLLSLAQLSPSCCNVQPWHVVVTEGNGTERFRQALFDFASSTEGRPEEQPDFPHQRRYPGIYYDRQRECRLQLYESVGIALGDRKASAAQALENFRFFGAPHVAIIMSEAELGIYGAIDCGIYLGNFLTVAQSLGIAACPQASLALYPKVVRDHFKLPENRLVIYGVSFGYADPAHPANQFRTRRIPVGETVMWGSE